MSDGHAARQADRGVKLKGKKTKNDKANWPAISYVSSFLIGVILFYHLDKTGLISISPGLSRGADWRGYGRAAVWNMKYYPQFVP